jgi:cytidyltransferase-like protein
MTKTIAICSGGFDPCHGGHLSYFRSARGMADMLVVGVNSDQWLSRKKGQPFINYDERAALVAELRVVDEVMAFDDSDNSACDLIKRVRAKYPDVHIMFCNGGDRTASNIPEIALAEHDEALSFHFSVGGGVKQNSSSQILANWQYPGTRRPWGSYKVLDEAPGYKVKILEVEPQAELSLQRHWRRSEIWQVLEGTAGIRLEVDGEIQDTTNSVGDTTMIDVGQWHQLYNPGNTVLRVLEVQRGECREEDIERLGVSEDYGKFDK